MNNYSDIPVSIFLASSILIVFSLYISTLFKSIPCGQDLVSRFYSNFVHIELYHLTANLLALYSLSRVERKIGVKKFIGLIIFLLIFNSTLEVLMYKFFPTIIQCSIGFSGVLFGITTYELITTKEIDLFLIISIIGLVTLPSLKNSKVSFISHLVGALSGIIGGFIYNNLNKI